MFKSKWLVTISVLVALLLPSATTVSAANETEIEQSIIDGLAWLVAQQDNNPGPNFGSWTAYYSYEGTGTCLALYKLSERAYELGYDSPFDPNYQYSQNVTTGFDWLFANVGVINITPQDHTIGATGTVDDPDTNNNGIGVRVTEALWAENYQTGICLAAISASGTPSRVVNVLGSPVNGSTYLDVAQDMVDFLAYGQVDPTNASTYDPSPTLHEGGWDYTAVNNTSGGTPWKGDNSNTGYVVLGLGEAQAFGATIPQWVKTELNVYIDYMQDDITGDAKDGGSWYSWPGDGIGVNTLKTGNLIFEMALVGDTPTTQRVVDALDYLTVHWNNASGANSPPGWNGTPAQYQAMFTIMKGLEFMGIDNFNGIDWFEDISDAIVAQQDQTAGPTYGSWQSSSGRGEPVIITEWALLTLERVAPPPPTTEVGLDVKPGSCPNPINTGSNGVLPVAIAGTDTLDVMDINISTVLLGVLNESTGEIENPISPIRYTYEDVTEPYIAGEDDPCCIENEPDATMDLSLKFDTQELVASGLDDYVGQEICLGIEGSTNDGQDFSGKDCVRIQAPKKTGKNK